MHRCIDNSDAKSIFENLIYLKSKVATSEVFTHLLESLIYNNLETKIKPVKVSAAAISACLEKFRFVVRYCFSSFVSIIRLFLYSQSPISICKNYELLIMSCCLMQLLDSVSQNQRIERIFGLEKVNFVGLGNGIQKFFDRFLCKH